MFYVLSGIHYFILCLCLAQELKCVSAEKRLVLDTVNEVGSALLDLVPWRAREGLDRLVADANQRYRQADETITQRVQLVQAAIQRSQQVLQQILVHIKVSFIINSATCTAHTYRELKLRYSQTLGTYR